ncbi:hypothetical protein MMC17_003586 [Xylographa soralifera]|nr:hypothetical protein [Xylographa soralifera]
MALGFGKRANVVETNPNTITQDRATAHARDPAFETGVYGYDTEKQGESGRKLSRVGGTGVLGDSDAESEMSVGKQMEAESMNSIKYRTCSWQKVTEPHDIAVPLSNPSHFDGYLHHPLTWRVMQKDYRF